MFFDTWESNHCEFLCLSLLIFLINSLSIITDTLNYHYLIEHTRKRLKEGVGGGSVLLQLHSMVETSEEIKVTQ